MSKSVFSKSRKSENKPKVGVPPQKTELSQSKLSTPRNKITSDNIILQLYVQLLFIYEYFKTTVVQSSINTMNIELLLLILEQNGSISCIVLDDLIIDEWK